MQQNYVAVASNAMIDFEISLDAATSKIDQKVWVNGKLVSQRADGQSSRQQASQAMILLTFSLQRRA